MRATVRIIDRSRIPLPLCPEHAVTWPGVADGRLEVVDVLPNCTDECRVCEAHGGRRTAAYRAWCEQKGLSVAPAIRHEPLHEVL